ncbi:MAG: mannonate dehydratase [Deinococcales bacterium]
MKQTWRWFGPHDTVSVEEMLQCGVEGVVSALHHLPNGSIWSKEEIQKRQAEIGHKRDGSPSKLTWDVVESLPVSEAIKKQKGPYLKHLKNYKTSLEHLALSGIEVICYNFMPLLDWTRTDLNWQLPHGGSCMRFDLIDFAVFDIYLLQRARALEAYPEDILAAAKERYQNSGTELAPKLIRNIAAGLPGSTEKHSLDDLRGHLAEYDQISAERLRQNLIDFLSEVVPTAEALGLRLCCHPDDPPFPLLGLPRVMSSEDDYLKILTAVDSFANGVTLCSGSLGARADNDLPSMMERLGHRVHFLHLRNVHREALHHHIQGSFYEDEHLKGDTDMVALIAAILQEENRRKAQGRKDINIPMRPDHGQDILDDLKRQSQPGYPLIGRMKGLAELRGIILALSHPQMAFNQINNHDRAF